MQQIENEEHLGNKALLVDLDNFGQKCYLVDGEICKTEELDEAYDFH